MLRAEQHTCSRVRSSVPPTCVRGTSARNNTATILLLIYFNYFFIFWNLPLERPAARWMRRFCLQMSVIILERPPTGEMRKFGQTLLKNNKVDSWASAHKINAQIWANFAWKQQSRFLSVRPQEKCANLAKFRLKITKSILERPPTGETRQFRIYKTKKKKRAKVDSWASADFAQTAPWCPFREIRSTKKKKWKLNDVDEWPLEPWKVSLQRCTCGREWVAGRGGRKWWAWPNASALFPAFTRRYWLVAFGKGCLSFGCALQSKNFTFPTTKFANLNISCVC